MENQTVAATRRRYTATSRMTETPDQNLRRLVGLPSELDNYALLLIRGNTGFDRNLVPLTNFMQMIILPEGGISSPDMLLHIKYAQAKHSCNYTASYYPNLNDKKKCAEGKKTNFFHMTGKQMQATDTVLDRVYDMLRTSGEIKEENLVFAAQPTALVVS